MLGKHPTTELYPNPNKAILALLILNLDSGYGFIEPRLSLLDSYENYPIASQRVTLRASGC